jgi:hypothetical protein
MWRKDNTRPENYSAVFQQCGGHSSLRESGDLVDLLDGVRAAAALNEPVELQSWQTESCAKLLTNIVGRVVLSNVYREKLLISGLLIEKNLNLAPKRRRCFQHQKSCNFELISCDFIPVDRS